MSSIRSRLKLEYNLRFLCVKNNFIYQELSTIFFRYFNTGGKYSIGSYLLN